MPTISHGNSDYGTDGYVLVSQGESRDQDGRKTWVREFEGTQDGMDTLRAALAGDGSSYTVSFAPGGKCRLTAVYPFVFGVTESPVDVWDYEEVATQPSIYTHPSVAPVLTATYKAAIETALRDNAVNPYASATSGSDWVMRNVFDRLQRGTEAWEANKPFVRRTRSFSGAYGSPATLTLTSTVYSRSSLISTFSVPSDFQPRIPANPSWTAPAQTTWGWRKGPQSSSYNRATRRWEEVFVFEGNFWDNALYTFV